jgi:hypothetical protein
MNVSCRENDSANPSEGSAPRLFETQRFPFTQEFYSVI